MAKHAIAPVAEHIITACCGYTSEHVNGLLNSLALVGYSGTLHVIVGKNDFGFQQTRIANYSVILHRVARPRNVYENRFARAVQFLPLFSRELYCGQGYYSKLSRCVLDRALPVSSLRYLVALRIVRELPRQSVVMLTDSRDVYFQDQPFSFLHGGGKDLLFSLEEHRINEGNITWKWIRDVYGIDTALRWNGQRASCSGTTMGRIHAVEEYLTKISDEIMKHRNRVSHTVGYDQGIHNYLLYSGELPSAYATANGDGPFFVAQQLPEFDREGLILDREGRAIPVVHQFDRVIDSFRPSLWFQKVFSK